MTAAKASIISLRGKSKAMVVVFGPQCSLGSEAIVKMNRSLAGDVDLEFLIDVLKDLPSLWQPILDAYPDLARISGLESLSALGRFFDKSKNTVLSPGLASTAEFTENVVLTPLTVVSQLIDFWKLNHGFPGSSMVMASGVTDVQGFCVGFLAATVVACTRDMNDFKTIASAAVRLAVCIGALVDLDRAADSGIGDPTESVVSIAIRWKSNEDFEHLQRSLASFPTVRNPSTCFIP